jgi:hypothetical protein
VTYEEPPVLASAVVVAVVLAVALGGTVDAAEIVAAAVEPAVAVTLTLGDAVAEAEAEALTSAVCASAADTNSITARIMNIMPASIVAADSDNDSFLLNSILVPPCNQLEIGGHLVRKGIGSKVRHPGLTSERDISKWWRWPAL